MNLHAKINKKSIQKYTKTNPLILLVLGFHHEEISKHKHSDNERIIEPLKYIPIFNAVHLDPF